MRVLAIVILFHPDWLLLRRNLNAFIEEVDGVLAWDNSSKDLQSQNRIILQHDYPQVNYVASHTNVGISHALNYAWQYAREKDFDVLLTMDDDSIFENFAAYRHRVEAKWKREGLCVCGPVSNLHQKKKLHNKGFIRVPDLITSGMLVPLPLLETCNGYCEDFVIDGIDVELCYHLKSKGYAAYIDTATNLIQRFGNPVNVCLLGKNIACTVYNPERLYNIFRNHIIIWRTYNHPYSLLKKICIKYFLRQFLKSFLLVRAHRSKRLSALIHGIWDGFCFTINS